MEPDTLPPLSPIQKKAALALAAGASLTGAAAEAGIHRVTIYRWLKNNPRFAAAARQNRTEFMLARRDDLRYLSNRALEALLTVFDNPRSSPTVLLQAAMFTLKRSQQPGKGWCVPEPLPETAAGTLIDSAVLERDFHTLASVDDLEDATCNTMLQEETEDTAQPEDADQPEESEACESPYRHGGLPSCPVPANVVDRRSLRDYVLNALDELKAAAPPNFRAANLNHRPPATRHSEPSPPC